MKLKLKNAEQFRRLLTALLDDLVDARFHFNLHQALARATEDYGTEFSQSPTFWGLTFGAHMDAVMVRLCRAYDTYAHSALNLRNLLDTIEANLVIFDEPNFRQRLKGNAFVDSLAAELTPPDRGQLRKDTEAVSDSDPLVHKLVMWRHNYIAHRNSHFALNPKKFDTQYPLTFAEMDALLNRSLEIGNRYSLLFDASAHGTLMVGRDDYLNVLKAVREYVQAYERGREEEWKRLGGASYAEPVRLSSPRRPDGPEPFACHSERSEESPHLLRAGSAKGFMVNSAKLGARVGGIHEKARGIRLCINRREDQGTWGLAREGAGESARNHPRGRP